MIRKIAEMMLTMQINVFFHVFVKLASNSSSSKHARAILLPLRADFAVQNLIMNKKIH